MKNQGLDSKAARFICRKTQNNIEKRRVIDAANWLSIGLFFDSERTLSRIRRNGVFRASKYHFQSKMLSGTLECAFSEDEVFDLSSEDRNYLRSVSALLDICPAFHQTYLKILSSLRKEKRHVIKTLIAIVDLRFACETSPNLSATPSSLEYYTQEELAEAVSFLVHLFDEVVGLDANHLNWVDPAGLSKKKYKKILVDACQLIAYREAEILLDTFAYSVETDNGSVIVIPHDPALEKSIRAGYIVDQLQLETDAQKTLHDDAKDAMSLEHIIDQIDHAAGSNMFRRIEQPVPRYALFFPDHPEIRRAFGGDGLFQEDIVRLFSSAKANFTIPEVLAKHPITPGLVVHDVVKIQRFFDLVRKLMARKLLPLLETDPIIVLRSILPVFDRPQLRKLLTVCVDDTAAEAFITLIDPKVGNPQSIFDLQYQPALRAEDFFMLPLNVLCASDLVRNLLYLDKSRTSQSSGESSKDSIRFPQEILASAIEQRASHVTQEQKWEWSGQQMEVDIVALVGKYLLLVECKDPYHPCNTFELRTSFEHMKKGSHQLTRVSDALSQPRGLVAFLNLLGWSADEPPLVVTCICSSNRIFSGYVFDGHPVRNIFEMSNFFVSGSGVLFGEETSLWKDQRFDPEDLHTYLNEHPFYTKLFSDMRDIRRFFSAGRSRLEFATFGWDISRQLQAHTLNLESSVGRGGVCACGDAGQGATTRNSPLLQGVATQPCAAASVQSAP